MATPQYTEEYIAIVDEYIDYVGQNITKGKIYYEVKSYDGDYVLDDYLRLWKVGTEEFNKRFINKAILRENIINEILDN